MFLIFVSDLSYGRGDSCWKNVNPMPLWNAELIIQTGVPVATLFFY